MRKTTLSYAILAISILLTVGYVAAQQSHPIGEIITTPSGGTIWHSLNDGPGSQLNADLLDGHDTSYFWHSENHGPGSGLDADTLDGQHAAALLDSPWTPTGANIYFTGGQVGIGTNSPTNRLHVVGNSRMVGNLVVTGSVTANEFLYSSSDSRLKTDVKVIESPLEKVLQLEGVTFRWKESGNPGIGLIAQDVEKVFPELVGTDQESGMKSLAYGNLVAPLIEAIKEQQGQIEQLRQEIESLKSKC